MKFNFDVASRKLMDIIIRWVVVALVFFWSYPRDLLGRVPTVGGIFKPVPQLRLISARTGSARKR